MAWLVSLQLGLCIGFGEHSPGGRRARQSVVCARVLRSHLPESTGPPGGEMLGMGGMV